MIKSTIQHHTWSKLSLVFISTLIIFNVILTGCITINPPSATQPTLPHESTPEYHTVSFTLQDGKDYSFPVYIRNEETLHLVWRTGDEHTEVWFHIITPSGISLGFYDNEGQFADRTLREGFCRRMNSGITQFKPSDYGWGESYYTMMVNDWTDEPASIKIEYWIER